MKNAEVHYAEDLDNLTAPCDSPECDYDHSVYCFASKCHPKSSVYVVYKHKTNKVLVLCHKCNRTVVTLAVESRTIVHLSA
jgi:hypothetical protein